MKMCD